MNRVYLSLGSNIDPETHIRGAIAALSARYGRLIISPVYQTPAVGFNGDDFYNLVVGLDTDESVETLAAACREIEKSQGRQRSDQRFSARTLDIDPLTVGTIIREHNPMLPRDEILKYAFVLRPLADIAADERHPSDGRTYGEIWAEPGTQLIGHEGFKSVTIDFSADIAAP